MKSFKRLTRLWRRYPACDASRPRPNPNEQIGRPGSDRETPQKPVVTSVLSNIGSPWQQVAMSHRLLPRNTRYDDDYRPLDLRRHYDIANITVTTNNRVNNAQEKNQNHLEKESHFKKRKLYFDEGKFIWRGKTFDLQQRHYQARLLAGSYFKTERIVRVIRYLYSFSPPYLCRFYL